MLEILSRTRRRGQDGGDDLAVPLERIRIDRVRCLTEVECRLHPKRNFFFGSNGAGKTSFLEAVYLLGRGRSFRTRQTRRLIQRGAAGLSVFGEQRLERGIRRIGVSFEAGALECRIDRQPAGGVLEVAANWRVDVIDPSVHQLIEGGPSERRRFLDWGVFHVEQHFLQAWRTYRRALGQRNAALKHGRGGSELWDRALIEAGEHVDGARRAYVERLAPLGSETGRALLGEPIDVMYRSGWREGVSFSEALRESADRDAAAGFTQVGPHRGDLQVRLGQRLVGDEASRGQQKLVAAGLVVAQVLDAGSSRDATLLVDDPAAELDKGALGRLLRVLQDVPGQVIFTGLSEQHLPPPAGFPVFHVEQGRIKECYNGSV